MINFAEARERIGLTREAAASHIGISVSALEFYEKNQGEISLSDAVMLAKLYKTKINAFCFK